MKEKIETYLQPYQKRTKGTMPSEQSAFMKVFNVISPIVMYYIGCQIVIIFFGTALQEAAETEGFWENIAGWIAGNTVAASAIVKAASMVAGVIVVYPFLKKETPVIKMPEGHKKDIILLLCTGAFTALCFNIFFSLIQFTGSSANYEQVAQVQFALPLWAGILLYGFFSPIAEEMVFRGLVYNRLDREYTKGIAIIGSSILFGVYHGNIVQALYGFLLGLMIAVLYEKYGSFLVPVVLHSAANICIYVVSSNLSIQKICMSWLGFLVCLFISVVLLKTCLLDINKE